ncbi:MAG: hypothetical protein PHN72_03645 [Bacilli bacterium]|nr:hypothetical protein [Bacilli bacterium]
MVYETILKIGKEKINKLNKELEYLKEEKEIVYQNYLDAMDVKFDLVMEVERIKDKGKKFEKIKEELEEVPSCLRSQMLKGLAKGAGLWLLTYFIVAAQMLMLLLPLPFVIAITLVYGVKEVISYLKETKSTRNLKKKYKMEDIISQIKIAEEELKTEAFLDKEALLLIVREDFSKKEHIYREAKYRVEEKEKELATEEKKYEEIKKYTEEIEDTLQENKPKSKEYQITRKRFTSYKIKKDDPVSI